ncbi:MAG: DUF5104 domain-containing protein [Clostridia bacterium]|nr:DUF5104 domain-containing protein [Clostridia bacterium]
MKKIALLFILITMLSFFCGCGAGNAKKIFLSETHVVDYYTEVFLDAVEAQDVDQIKTLFAPNALTADDDFDESVVELFSYYEGNHEPFGEGKGTQSSTQKSDGNVRKEIEGTYDVSTDKGDYRIAIKYVYIDTVTPDNEGIWCVYIIKHEDDPNQDYAYRGDLKDTPGINIGLSWSRQPWE